jgi:hypothetical protein
VNLPDFFNCRSFSRQLYYKAYLDFSKAILAFPDNTQYTIYMIIKFPKNRILYLSTFKLLAALLILSIGAFICVAQSGYQLLERIKRTQEFEQSRIILKPTVPLIPDNKTLSPTPIQSVKQIADKAPIKPKASALQSNPLAGISCNGTIVYSTTGVPVCQEFPKPVATTDPLQINFIDETGAYSSTESMLKNYMAKLHTSVEISSLSALKIVDVGDTGWAGQYIFSYTKNSAGQITSITGLIKLNVFYYKNKPQLNDYLKLVLAHEYGHHYTLYYKLTKWNLGINTRFPDEYYSTRPLTKNGTTFDYSLGWENCDAEIIAEDYSYLYSGYGFHGMADKYGYPSQALSDWLKTSFTQGPSASPPPSINDAPPVVSITAPSDNTEVSSTITIQASASDDKAVSRVSFYINDKLITHDASAPYETALNTGLYPNGPNTIKAIAADSSNQTSSSTITVIINNSKPAITINAPATDPYYWVEGDLLVDVSASSDVGIRKIEIYIDNQLAGQRNGSRIIGTLSSLDIPAGTYTIKAVAYDRANISNEKTLVFIKQF